MRADFKQNKTVPNSEEERIKALLYQVLYTGIGAVMNEKDIDYIDGKLDFSLLINI